MNVSSTGTADPQIESDFERISDTYRSSIYAIRGLADNIAPMADEHDKGLFKDFVQGVLDSVGIRQTIDWTQSPPVEQPAEPKTRADLDEAISQFANAVKTRAEKDPGFSVQFARHLRAWEKRKPAAHLLRSGILITLTSHLDVLIASLIRIFYKTYPGALPAQDNQITLQDLRELGSIDAAESYIIEKQINARLYEGFTEQLKYFSGKLNVWASPRMVGAPT